MNNKPNCFTKGDYMKHTILAVLLALTSSIAMGAAHDTSPFEPEVDKRFKVLEATGIGGSLASGKVIVGSAGGVATARTLSGAATVNNTGVVSVSDTSADGAYAAKVVKATYDFGTMGGAVSTISLGQTLPAKALIRQAWFYVDTTPTSGGTPAVTFFCEDAANLLASTDVTTWSAGQFKSGVETGTAATMVGAISAQCNISIGIATAALTAGKIELFVEYTVSN